MGFDVRWQNETIISIDAITFSWSFVDLSQLHFAFASPSCRFVPSCSQYATDAIKQYGAIIGSFLALKRLLRCHPFARAGIDEVPVKRKRANEGKQSYKSEQGYKGEQNHKGEQNRRASRIIKASKAIKASKPIKANKIIEVSRIIKKGF